MRSKAEATYQSVLDANSRHLWEGAFDRIVETWVLPAEIGTYDRVIAVETPEALVDFARDFRANLETLGAQAYYRHCLRAEFLDGDCIVGEHTVFALRGWEPVIEPFNSEMTLVLRDGHWLVQGVITQARSSDVRASPGMPRLDTDN